MTWLALPAAHLGHFLPLLPFFAPPLAVALGIGVLALVDRLGGRGR